MSFVTMTHPFGLGVIGGSYSAVLDAADQAADAAGLVIQEEADRVNRGFVPTYKLFLAKSDLEKVRSGGGPTDPKLGFTPMSLAHFGVQFPYQIPNSADGQRYRSIIRKMIAWETQASDSLMQAQRLGPVDFSTYANDVGQIAQAYYDRLTGAANPTPFPRGSGAEELYKKLPGTPTIGATGLLIGLGALLLIAGKGK